MQDLLVTDRSCQLPFRELEADDEHPVMNIIIIIVISSVFIIVLFIEFCDKYFQIRRIYVTTKLSSMAKNICMDLLRLDFYDDLHMARRAYWISWRINTI